MQKKKKLILIIKCEIMSHYLNLNILKIYSVRTESLKANTEY